MGEIWWGIRWSFGLEFGVELVVQDRVADGGHMKADLMFLAGLGAHLEKAVAMPFRE